MVKGWRNDPKWIEFYKQRDKERIERQVLLMKMEFSNQQLLEDERQWATQLQRHKSRLGLAKNV